jgi:hypothetical protein
MQVEKEAARRATVLPFGSPPRLRSPRGACIEAARNWGGFTQQRVDVLKRTHQAMRWLTIRLRRYQYHRHVVPGAAVVDLDHFGDTAHPTQSGLERDNTPADCKSRRAAPPCPAWPASRGARAHRADFSWTAHFQGRHGYTADICQLSIHGRVSPSSAVGGLRSRGRFSRRLQLGPGLWRLLAGASPVWALPSSSAQIWAKVQVLA